MWFLVAVLVLQIVDCQKRLYYTGAYKNDNTNSIFFEGAQVSTSDLFAFSNITSDWIPESNSSFIFSGGTFVRLKHVNVTLDDEFLHEIKLAVLGTTDGSQFEFGNAAYYKQLSSFDYGLAMSNSSSDANAFLLEAEIGLYDHAQDAFISKYWREISGGDLIAVTAITTESQGEIDGTPLGNSSLCVAQHRVVFTSDFMGRRSVSSHTWSGCTRSPTETPAAGLSSSEESAFQPPLQTSKPLRVMTYNLWHNNPPSWIYQQKMYFLLF